MATTTLSALLARSDLTDHDEVLQAANASLRQSPTDAGAQHARVVALLKLDRYSDALRALDEGGDELKARASLEWAYALYKTGSLDEAVDVARRGGEERRGGPVADRGMRHVLAQASYRLEDFESAAEVYAGLSESRESAARNEEDDLRVNRGAVDAQLEWQGRGYAVLKKKPAREDLEAFETAYNAACGCIARGELAQGEMLLKRAIDLCNASDELAEDDKRAEMLPILVQQLYVLVRLGKVEEAESLASSIAFDEIADQSTKRIAQTNALAAAASTSTNPFLAHRKYHAMAEGTKADSPFTHQSRILKEDAYVLDLWSLKYSGVAKSTARCLSQVPSSSTSSALNSLSVLNAAATAASATGKAGIKAILPLLEKRPHDVGLLLTIVQLYVLSNNYDSAVSLVETFFSKLEQSSRPADQDVRFAPGLVATLVSLYSAQSRRCHIRTELAKAAAYWRGKIKSWSDDRASALAATSLLKAAGAELLSTSGPEQELPASIFTDLHAALPMDPAVNAGLVASWAVAKPSALDSTLKVLDTLPDAQRLVLGVDADALEAAGVATLPAPAAVAGKRSADGLGLAKDRKEDERQKKKRKLSAKRRPKEFVEGKEMDVERWLPMKDRTYYRPKGKKGKARAAGGGGGTQGGMVEEKSESGKQVQVQTGVASGGSSKKKSKKKGAKF